MGVLAATMLALLLPIPTRMVPGASPQPSPTDTTNASTGRGSAGSSSTPGARSPTVRWFVDQNISNTARVFDYVTGPGSSVVDGIIPCAALAAAALAPSLPCAAECGVVVTARGLCAA